MPTALLTGASRGLGQALAAALARRGWSLVVDARDAATLDAAARSLDAVARAAGGHVEALAGDVLDPGHRRDLVARATRTGRLDLLVNNASRLGPSPLPSVTALDPDEFARILAVDVVAPQALIRAAAPALAAAGGVVLNVSSDAAVEAYPGWGGYGAAKAALDHLTAVLAAERPDLRVYAVDPGDMRTEMHQRAFPGEDISDRPDPATRVPGLLRLLDERPPSGRYKAGELATAAAGGRP